jgi:hypothetical protein
VLPFPKRMRLCRIDEEWVLKELLFVFLPSIRFLLDKPEQHGITEFRKVPE